MAQAKKRASDAAEIVEQGHIWFLFRPKVEEHEPKGLKDVERFHVALKPHGGPFRLLTIGRKRLPDARRHERNWGFIDLVTKDGPKIERELREQEYDTKTRGHRVRPAARPAGEGVYAIVQPGRDMHLVYALELPEKPGAVQKALKIAPEDAFVLSVKNPEKPAPPGVGLGEARKADYPKKLQAEFEGRRFAPSDPRLLDYEGAEFILVGAREDPERAYGVELETERERLDTSELVRKLRMEAKRHPVEPLLAGRWS